MSEELPEVQKKTIAERTVDMADIPILTEAEKEDVFNKLLYVAKLAADLVYAKMTGNHYEDTWDVIKERLEGVGFPFPAWSEVSLPQANTAHSAKPGVTVMIANPALYQCGAGGEISVEGLELVRSLTGFDAEIEFLPEGRMPRGLVVVLGPDQILSLVNLTDSSVSQFSAEKGNYDRYRELPTLLN